MHSQPCCWGGASFAWADTSTIYNWGTTTDGGATVWTDTEKGTWTGTTPDIDATYGLGVSASTKSTTTCTRTIDIDGTAILTYTAEWYVSTTYGTDYKSKLILGDFLTLTAYGSNSALSVTVNGAESNKVNPSAEATTFSVSCTVNTVTRTITAFSVKEGTTTRLSMSHLTTGESCTLSAEHSFSSITLSRTSANTRLTTSRLKSMKITQETQTLSKYGYTIKYMTDIDNDATTLKTVDKTAEADKVYDGTVVYAESPFTESETKYYTTDDATTMFSITSDNQVCKVKVREAYTWNWTLKGKCSDIDLGTIESGTVTEGEAVSTYWKHMLLYNQKLYKRDPSSNSFAISFTPTEDNYVKELDYSATDYDNVVLLIEAEDVATLTIPTTNVAQSNRCSGGKGAYAASNVTLFSLPAGTYKFSARGGAYSKGVYTYGSNELLTVDCSNTSSPSLQTSSVFKLTESTPINVGQYVNTTNSGDYGSLDYFFVQQTAVNISSVDALGYTFSSTLPLDFTNTDVEAYTAAYNSTNKTVTLNRVNKVPANTGLFIKGTAADIPVLTGEADDMGTNNLIAVSATTTVNQTDGDNTNFVLGVDNVAAPTAAVFLKAPTAGVSVGAGKAYLQIPTASAPSEARMTVVFADDETTGIADARGKMSDVNGLYYNLSGQRIENPGKGLYIKNGKKIIVK